MNINEFDKLKKSLGRESKIHVRDEDGKIIRTATILMLDQHFDWDKNDTQQYPPKMEWNGVDYIYSYSVGCLKFGGNLGKVIVFLRHQQKA